MTQRLEAQGGKKDKYKWDDGSDHDEVKKIFVQGDSQGIQCIQFDYIKNRQPKYGSFNGYPAQGFTKTFEINHLKGEQLESVEGYYEPKSSVIQGIQFKTNLRVFEMIGIEKKCTKFSLSVSGKKIVGFHGSAFDYLNSLGAYFIDTTPTILEARSGRGKEWNDGADNECVTISPFTKFSKLEYSGDTTMGILWDDGTYEGVKKVNIYYDKSYVRCLRFEYDNGGKVERKEHGFKLGKEEEFVVDNPNEFITSVEGTLQPNRSHWWVSSLTFKTSKGRTSPTFGTETSSKFVLESKGCAIIGFHGRCNGPIWALGAYFRPLPPFLEVKKLEAQGGNGGVSWDDGSFDGIKKIYIGHNELGIAFVNFLYDKDNHAIVGDDHGNKKIYRVAEFELDYPSEYLISVKGKYDVVDGSESEVIVMLKFKTNMRTSQVFGLETTSNFTLEKECHKIVGFHGRSSNMLHQIGIHVLPIPTDYLHISI